MNEFTLLDFSDNTENDENKRLLQQANLDQLQILKAPENAVRNILNYSKALSVRKSKKLKHIKNLLN